MQTFGEQLADQVYQPRRGAYAIIFKEGKIATMKAPQGYFLPGGGIEAGEDFEAALKREAIEELGWEITVGKQICEARQFYYSAFKDKYIENQATFFLAEHTGGETEAKTEPNHDLAWLTPDEAKEKLFHRHQAWAVKQI